jgi:hypothetical protein
MFRLAVFRIFIRAVVIGLLPVPERFVSRTGLQRFIDRAGTRILGPRWTISRVQVVTLS